MPLLTLCCSESQEKGQEGEVEIHVFVFWFKLWITRIKFFIFSFPPQKKGLISVCKNASHYHSVCDFFFEESKN